MWRDRTEGLIESASCIVVHASVICSCTSLSKARATQPTNLFSNSNWIFPHVNYILKTILIIKLLTTTRHTFNIKTILLLSYISWFNENESQQG